MGSKEAGFQLVELLVLLLVLSIVAALGLPAAFSASAGSRVRLAAAELVTGLRMARSYAVRHNVNVGLKLVATAEGGVSYRLYRDGDGDGVRTRDILGGIDTPAGPERTMAVRGSRVGLGFPPGRPPRDPGDPRRRLARLDDPIRLGRSDIASFSALGTATPGTLYLTDRRHHLVAVRITSMTGRVKVLVYDREREVWE